MKTREAKKVAGVRQRLEVNMREFERESLARFDVFARVLEIVAMKQKRG